MVALLLRYVLRRGDRMTPLEESRRSYISLDGFMAAKAGISIIFNPYAKYSNGYVEWMRGYKAFFIFQDPRLPFTLRSPSHY